MAAWMGSPREWHAPANRAASIGHAKALGRSRDGKILRGGKWRLPLQSLIVKQNQKDAFSSGSATKRKQTQNNTSNCKTETSPTTGAGDGGCRNGEPGYGSGASPVHADPPPGQKKTAARAGTRHGSKNKNSSTKSFYSNSIRVATANEVVSHLPTIDAADNPVQGSAHAYCGALGGRDNSAWTELYAERAQRIAASIYHKPTIEEVDLAVKESYRRYTGALGEDLIIDAVSNAAVARRQELRELAQAGAEKRDRRFARRYPPPLPSFPKTLPEKREAAERRGKLADFLVHQVPAAFIERLPRCASARAVLVAIIRLCALDRDRCDASINTIAELAGVSRSSVNQALRLLETLRLISIDSGQLRGTVSIIRVLATPLQKLVAYCRSRLKGWKRHHESDASQQLSFFEGGVQKISQKEDSKYISKAENRSRRKSGRLMNTAGGFWNGFRISPATT